MKLFEKYSFWGVLFLGSLTAMVVLVLVVIVGGATKIYLQWPERVFDTVSTVLKWVTGLLGLFAVVGWCGRESELQNAIDRASKRGREESERKEREEWEELERQKRELAEQIEESNRRIAEIQRERERILRGE
ncbi:MAG: hypothetical protein J5640_04210 [Bacteroidales bacterium]|nr:hypothetical protein [Bacteroidales bacterium]